MAKSLAGIKEQGAQMSKKISNMTFLEENLK